MDTGTSPVSEAVEAVRPRKASAWTTAVRRVAAPGTRLLHATTFVDQREPERAAFGVFLADGLPPRTPSSEPTVQLRLDRRLLALRDQAGQTTDLIATDEGRVRKRRRTEMIVPADEVASRARDRGTWRAA